MENTYRGREGERELEKQAQKRLADLSLGLGRPERRGEDGWIWSCLCVSALLSGRAELIEERLSIDRGEAIYLYLCMVWAPHQCKAEEAAIAAAAAASLAACGAGASWSWTPTNELKGTLKPLTPGYHLRLRLGIGLVGPGRLALAFFTSQEERRRTDGRAGRTRPRTGMDTEKGRAARNAKTLACVVLCVRAYRPGCWRWGGRRGR